MSECQFAPIFCSLPHSATRSYKNYTTDTEIEGRIFAAFPQIPGTEPLCAPHGQNVDN